MIKKHALAQAVLAMSASALSLRSENVKEIKAENKAFVPPPELLERGPSGYRKNQTNACLKKEPKTAEDYLALQAAEDRRLRRSMKRDADREATLKRLGRA